MAAIMAVSSIVTVMLLPAIMTSIRSRLSPQTAVTSTGTPAVSSLKEQTT
jgi:hypothetical protein